MRRKCLTPDAVFHTHIKSGSVAVKVTLPRPMPLSASAAKKLEHRLHVAIESALAASFVW